MTASFVLSGLSGSEKEVTAATGTGDIIYGLTQSNRLLKFSAPTPGTIDAVITVTGLQFGESLVGIDFRPATGDLFALGVTGGNVLRTYRINLTTGAATQIGGTVLAPQSAGVATPGTDYGFDFNPTVDRIRVVSNTRDNFRLDPNTGGIATNGVDTALTAGAVITGAAYDRNFVASPQPATTLYGIDANTDQLVTIGGINSIPSPNLGAVTAIGPLGVNTSNLVGFDIANDATGTAYASLATTATTSSLYRINLATGAATLVGLIDSGANLPLVDIAVAPAGALQFGVAAVTVAEGAGTATLTVNRVGGDCGTITVNVATSDGTATAGVDYTAVNTTLTFGPGVTTRTVTIPIINDNLDEPDETVNVTLSGNVGGRLIAPSAAVLTIADDDLSAVSISDVALAEGNAGTTNFVFTVTLSNPNVLPVTVNYTTADGTATGGVDYVAVTAAMNATVTFAPGTTTQTITIVVNGDVDGEDDETFFVNLANPVNGAIARAQGRGVIINDDIRLNVAGAPIPVEVSVVSDQKPGSLLIFPIYTSSAAAGNTTNTRFSITNVDAKVPVTVHLFQVDGSTCAVSDSYLCLTALQTATFLASDLDPGTTGYVVAVAVNAQGCPIIFNGLIGDEYVKFPTGHAANLGAEAVAGLAGLATTGCSSNNTAVQLNFDGVMYQPLPRIVAVDNLASRGDGNDPLLIVNRIGGSLVTSAGSISNIFGIVYDDSENPASFGFTTANCQFRSNISSAFPRTTPRLEQFIPAGRSGWMKLWGGSDIALLGAVINFNPNVSSSPSAFNQGHNLHKLTLTTAASVTIPVFPPAC